MGVIIPSPWWGRGEGWGRTMGNNKKEQAKHVAAKEVNNVETKKKRTEHQERQKDQGEKVVKWIFGVLVALAIIYMIWSFFVVQ